MIELDCNGEYAVIAHRVGIKKNLGLLDDWSTTISRTAGHTVISCRAASEAEGGGWWAAQTAAADRHAAVTGRDSRFYGSRLENPDSKVLFGPGRPFVGVDPTCDYYRAPSLALSLPLHLSISVLSTVLLRRHQFGSQSVWI